MPAAALRLLAPSPAPAHQPVARRIADFMAGASFEAVRPTGNDIDALRQVLPAHTRVYLTAIPGRAPDEAILTAARLRAAGFEPVPHLAVRGLASAAMLDDLVSRMAAAGVRRLMVIGGDHRQAAGPYQRALDVIECGLLQRHGIVEVGIAGYPDGHPRIAAAALDRALNAKIEAAAQTGLAVHIVTQFGFDAATTLRWLARLRDLGIEHPVRIGMAGPSRTGTLLRYAQRCGVRVSAQNIARNTGLTKRLIGMSTPDGVIRSLVEALASGCYGHVTPHFHSFGGLAATGRWAAAAAGGNIALDRAGGFSVEAP